MTDSPAHPRDAIQDLLDGRLDPASRRAVEGHLAGCEACRRETEILRETRSTAKRLFADEAVSAGLSSSVRLILDAEDSARARGPARRIGRVAAAAAVVIVALLAALWFRRAPDIVTAVSADLDGIAAGSIVLASSASDASDVERYFVEAGVPFRTRVFDLGMMGYQIVGAKAHETSNRPSALWVYRSAAGTLVVCEMVRGRETELPGGFEGRSHGGIGFRIYSRAGVTLVAWQEGDLLCVLASRMPLEDVVALAFAKAMKV